MCTVDSVRATHSLISIGEILALWHHLVTSVIEYHCTVLKGIVPLKISAVSKAYREQPSRWRHVNTFLRQTTELNTGAR